MEVIQLIAIVIISYLLGAVPFGLVMGKLRGVDVREYGSGRTGTTNVLRTLGVGAAAIVFLADVGKGVVAVLLARFFVAADIAPALPRLGEALAGLAAICGHNWSVYIKFRGGRGVTTGTGGIITMSPLVAAIAAAVFAFTVALSRYVSLGSILATTTVLIALIPLVIWGREPTGYLIYGLVGVPIIVFQHRDNIGRLLAGRERKLGERAR